MGEGTLRTTVSGGSALSANAPIFAVSSISPFVLEFSVYKTGRIEKIEEILGGVRRLEDAERAKPSFMNIVNSR